MNFLSFNSAFNLAFLCSVISDLLNHLVYVVHSDGSI